MVHGRLCMSRVVQFSYSIHKAATYAEYTIYNLVIYAKRMGGSLSRYLMDLSTRISYVTNRCSQKAGT